MADSRPPENANPPTGNIESPNCSRRAKSTAPSRAPAASFPMVVSGCGRGCVGMRVRLVIGVRVPVHRPFGASEKPPGFVRSQVWNHLPPSHEIEADAFEVMRVHDRCHHLAV